MAAARLRNFVSFSKTLLASKPDAVWASTTLLRPGCQAACQPMRDTVNASDSASFFKPHCLVGFSHGIVTTSKAQAEVGAAPAVEPGSAASLTGGVRPYVKTKKLTKQAKHIMQILDTEAVDAVRKERSIPNIKPGDVVQLRVEVPENKRRVSQVKGIVIAKRNSGFNSTFRIRRVLAGVGVEVVYPLYSPNIKEIKVISSRRVRRAKLYYLRDKVAKLSTF